MNPKTTEAQRRASAKYQAANTRLLQIRLNNNTDGDIMDWLGRQSSKSGAVKALIRQRIASEDAADESQR